MTKKPTMRVWSNPNKNLSFDEWGKDFDLVVEDTPEFLADILDSAQLAAIADSYVADISKYHRDLQIKSIRSLMERLHIGIRDFADSKIKIF
jgi:cellulose biosynthesis protein BcsQ